MDNALIAHAMDIHREHPTTTIIIITPESAIDMRQEEAPIDVASKVIAPRVIGGKSTTTPSSDGTVIKRKLNDEERQHRVLELHRSGQFSQSQIAWITNEHPSRVTRDKKVLLANGLWDE